MARHTRRRITNGATSVQTIAPSSDPLANTTTLPDLAFQSINSGIQQLKMLGYGPTAIAGPLKDMQVGRWNPSVSVTPKTSGVTRSVSRGRPRTTQPTQITT